jgi:hypothetical protein
MEKALALVIVRDINLVCQHYGNRKSVTQMCGYTVQLIK